MVAKVRMPDTLLTGRGSREPGGARESALDLGQVPVWMSPHMRVYVLTDLNV